MSEDINYKEDVILPAVKRGAEILDEALPGWHKAINLRLLNLATPNPNNPNNPASTPGTGCILCQLDAYLDEDLHLRLPRNPIRLKDFGDYNDGLKWLEYHLGDEINGDVYGFDIIDEYEDDDGEIWTNPYPASEYYTILDNLWKEEIAIRTGSSNQ